MTTSPGSFRGPLPFVPNEVGTLRASIRPLPDWVQRWEKGVQFDQWTTHPSAAPMDLYNPITNTLVCRPATWICNDTPETRAVRAFFPVQLRAVDGCDPMSEDVDQAKRNVLDVLSKDWSPLARYVWDGVAGATTGPVDFVTQNPRLTQSTTVAGQHNPVAALARLTIAMRTAGYRGQIWFHAPEWLAYAYGTAGMLTQNGTTLMLPGGHVLVADPSYPGTGEAGAPATAAATWMYATPPLFGTVAMKTEAFLYDPNAVEARGCSFVQWALARALGFAMWDQEFNFGTEVYWDGTHGSAT